ncbi:hypothetical protein QVD17_41447 [Tagetes erecta]|uniref:Uncharacterized protein n=1 Tax=Tagetes erecta TaxID=13708 RepID=A0AAD8JKH5_TARER|nr:hypothetical protein QVD17_41447 [Tagetes erecta]
MDSKKWKESLARIESMIVEIIDFLNNRPWLPSAPSSVVVTTSPPLTVSVTAPPKLATAPQPAPTPSTASIIVQPPKQSVTTAYFTLVPTPKRIAFSAQQIETQSYALNVGMQVNNLVFESWLKSHGISIHSKYSQLNKDVLHDQKLLMHYVVFRKLPKKQVSNRAARKHEWRPPWQAYYSDRLEWRPPWCPAVFVWFSTLRTR